MALDRCPGSHTAPRALVDRERNIRRGRVMIDSYGICDYCRREYYVRSPLSGKRGAGPVIRVHKGLPKRPDGGCPYRCSYYCDFDCYVSGARI